MNIDEVVDTTNSTLTVERTRPGLRSPPVSALRRLSAVAFVPKLLVQMVSHQLQTRCLQEVQLLSEWQQHQRPRGLDDDDGAGTSCVLDFSSGSMAAQSALPSGSTTTQEPVVYDMTALMQDDEQRSAFKTGLWSLLVGHPGARSADDWVGVNYASTTLPNDARTRQCPETIALPRRPILTTLAVALWRLQSFHRSEPDTSEAGLGGDEDPEHR